MCGILVIQDKSNQRFNNLNFDKIKTIIAKRGPDFQKIEFLKFNLLMCHSLLGINNLNYTESYQPRSSKNKRYHMVFNGQIYNFQEFKHLEKKYGRIKIDTDVILPLFMEFGSNFVSKLEGMFSIVIYDEVENIIHCYTDRLSIKNLFYYTDHKINMIASDINYIKEILKDFKIPISLNQEMAIKFIKYRQTSSEHKTFFNNIQSIGPSGYLKIQDNAISMNFYSNLNFLSKNEIPNQRKHLLKKLNIKNHNKIGVFFSGGMDSTYLIDLLIDNNDQKFDVFSIFDFENNEHEENINISELSKNKKKYNNIENFHLINVNDIDLIADGRECAKIINFPFPDTSMISHYKLFQLASVENCRVILTGNGGDEIFYGYYYHFEIFLTYLFFKFKLKKYFKYLKMLNSSKNIGIKMYLLKTIYHILPINIKNLYKNYFGSSIFLNFSEKDKFYFNPQNNLNNIFEREALGHSFSYSLPQFLDYEDKLAGSFGMESRPIFADYNLLLSNLKDIESNFYLGFKSKIKENLKYLNTNLKKKSHFNSPFKKYYLKNKINIDTFILDNVRYLEFINFNKVENFIKSNDEIDINFFRVFSLINFNENVIKS